VGPSSLFYGLFAVPLVTRSFEFRTADWLPLHEAAERIMAGVTPLRGERVLLSDSLGRALAEDLVADATLPPWNNSGMDGFAVRAKDFKGASKESPIRLAVIRHVRAGDAPGGPEVAQGQAVRIMTGAPVPPGADSVVRVEDTDAELESGTVQIFSDRDTGANVRPAGQDMRPGEKLLGRGHTIAPGTVGVLASAGQARVLVHGRPCTAVLTTGDELRGLDQFQDVRSGIGIPDSNGPMISAMVTAAGASVMQLGPSSDDEIDLRHWIDKAADCDALITIGGASMGDADLVKRVLDGMGYRSAFWRVRMRPGSPVGFGWIPRGDRLQPVFSLPGNPTSAFVTFELLVRPFLLQLGGHRDIERRRIVCRTEEVIRAPARLTYFLRVQLSGTGEHARVRLTGPQGSGLVSGLGRADGLAIIEEDVLTVEEGGEVTVMLIGG